MRLEDVEVWLTEAVQHYNRPPVVFDPWQAQHLAQRLRERRMPMVEFTFSNASVGRLALTMHRLLKDRQLKLYDDEALIDELGNVRLIETSPGSNAEPSREGPEESGHSERGVVTRKREPTGTSREDVSLQAETPRNRSSTRTLCAPLN